MTFPIYLISMLKDAERREELREKFPKYYQNFIHIEAVNGYEMNVREYFNCLSRSAELLSPAEVGCALSHIKVLEMFLNSGAECALILEDDVIGDDNGIDFLSQTLEKMSGDFFIHCGGELERSIWLRKGTEQLYELPHPPYIRLLRACCYIVTKTVAKSIVEKQKHSLRVADDWQCILDEVGCGLYYMGIFDHPKIIDNQSTIEPDRKSLGPNKKRIIANPEPKHGSFLSLPLWVYLYKASREISRILKQIRIYFSGYRLIKTKNIKIRSC